jgi:hypothetical protein
VPDEQVWKTGPILPWHETLEIALDLDGIVLAREAEALREAPDVGVDDDALRRAALRRDDVGRLAAGRRTRSSTRVGKSPPNSSMSIFIAPRRLRASCR